MLNQLAFVTLEKGLNSVLRLDPTALARLAALSGRVLAVECTAPAMSVFVLADDEGLHLHSQWSGTADCTLRAPATRLWQLLSQAEKTAILHADDVQLDGNTAVLLDLSDVLQNLELDWEYSLSQWLGPIATQALSQALRRSHAWGQRSRHSLHLSLAEYITEESRHLVGNPEAQARFAEIDHSVLAVDRLEARLEQLSQRLKRRSRP